ncbi:MAG: NAD(P)/FAD-dependent oxidoreductase [Candidatus Nanopelagicales bacterium]
MTDVLDRVLWWDQLPDELREPIGVRLDRDTETDVAIIGAGYTGLWTAYYLQRAVPGLRITLVDKYIAGYGASGRNGGWASALFPQDHTAIAERAGVSVANAMQRAMSGSVDEIGRVSAEHGWDVDWAKGGTIVVARTVAQWNAMQHRVEELRAAGIESAEQLLDAAATRAKVQTANTLGGVFTPHCAAIQPAKLVRLLARHVVAAGAQLFEHSPALAIEPGIVRTPGGDIRARYVIRATEGYTAEIPGQRRTLLPFYSLMVATEPLPESTWEQIGLEERPTFSDGRRLVIYGQRTADGRLAFGGRGAPYTFGSRIDARTELHTGIHRMLESTLIDLFPVLRRHRFTHAWGGILGIARDWWASVGLDPVTGVGWAGGYVGDGVGTSNLAGRTLAALIAQRTEDPLLALPWVDHHSRAWEPEPLRWMASTAGLKATEVADAIESRTGKPSIVGRFVGALTGH